MDLYKRKEVVRNVKIPYAHRLNYLAQWFETLEYSTGHLRESRYIPPPVTRIFLFGIEILLFVNKTSLGLNHAIVAKDS